MPEPENGHKDEERDRIRGIATDLESLRLGSWERSVKAVPFVMKGKPQAFIARLGGRDFEVEQVALKQADAFGLRFRDMREKLSKETQMTFFRLTSDIWLLVAVEPRYTFKYVAKRASRLSFHASPVFLSTKDFREVFRGLSAFDSRIRILQHSAYNVRESSIRFLREERVPDPIFRELLTQGLVLRNMTGGVTDNFGTRRLHARFSNNGTVTLNVGSLSFLFETAMMVIAELAQRKANLMQNRQRVSDTFSPLAIKFDRPVLREKSSNHLLIRVLAHVEKMGVGVFHSNPYVHLILTDFRDGSRFTLYSRSDSELELVPSFRSSVSSITRIHRAISEGLASCDLSTTEAKSLTLADFFDLGDEESEA